MIYGATPGANEQGGSCLPHQSSSQGGEKGFAQKQDVKRGMCVLGACGNE